MDYLVFIIYLPSQLIKIMIINMYKVGVTDIIFISYNSKKKIIIDRLKIFLVELHANLTVLFPYKLSFL